MSANICDTDSMMPMLYLYIHSKTRIDSMKEIYHSVYDHMTELILHQDAVSNETYSSCNSIVQYPLSFPFKTITCLYVLVQIYWLFCLFALHP